MTIIYSSTTDTGCMGPEWNHVTAVIDTEARVASGDLVRLGLVIEGRACWIIKRLRTHRGAWFLDCLFGCLPLQPWCIVPDAIQKVIAREPLLGKPPMRDPGVMAAQPTQAQWRYFESKTAEAQAAWATGEEVIGAPFPGLDAVVGPRPPSHQMARSTA
jgi:hypothetical protein